MSPLIGSGSVDHVDPGVQQLADAVERRFTARTHLDQLGDGHDGPDDGREVTDELHQLAGREHLLIHEVSAVAEDDADDGLHEQRDHDVQYRGQLDVVHVGVLVLLVQLAEAHQLDGLLDEGLDDGDAGEVLLREVGQIGESLLTLVPPQLEIMSDDSRDDQQEHHRDQREQRQHGIHDEHLDHGHPAEEQRVRDHQDAGAEAVLHGLEVVRKECHQVADLIDGVVLLREVLAVVEHPAAEVRLDVDARAEEAETPQEAPDDHADDDEDHREADAVEQKVHVEGDDRAVGQHGSRCIYGSL